MSVIDPVFRIAAPPVDLALTAWDQVLAIRLIIVCGVIITLAVLFTLRQWSRSGSPVLLLLILGGALTNLLEPFVDLAAACWHPIVGQHTLFENMARPMPVWLLFAYVAYFGVLPMIMYHAFSRGISTRAMWLWFLVPVAADIVLEESLMSLSSTLYVYYGNQPLRLHTFPLWWAATNTIGVYLSAVMMTIFVPRLRGWHLVLVPLKAARCYCNL